MFARNGFQNVAEKAKLGKFILERFTSAEMEKYTPAERVRMSFEQLGPSFVKFGQLLATRPDLVPPDFVEEFKKLHDQVSSVPYEQIESVLREQFGADTSTVFQEIDRTPLAAASIAQVHRARLKNGREVVVKVQRPGISQVINDDLSILYFLADLLQKYVPETRVYNPVGIVDEFFKTLELETNFVVEANNIRRFTENFKNEPQIKIPHIYFEYSGPRVLVLEHLAGVPLSNRMALEQEGIDRSQVMRIGLRAYLKMVFKDGLFHGDLHAGNLFIMPNNQIGLIDFGIVGRLNRRTQTAVANMFVALYSEDYERLAYEYVDLAPYTEAVDVDRFAKDLQDLLAPYFGLTLKNVNVGRLLMNSTSVAARHRLVLPTELMLFFKSIVTVEGMGSMVMKEFDLLSSALEFASELVKNRYEPKRMREDFQVLARDSASLLYALPRQLKQLVRKVNHPDFAVQINVHDLDEIKRSIETSSNIVFLGLVIGSLILAGALTMFIKEVPYLFGLPFPSTLGFGLAAILGLVAFRNYIRK